MSTNNREFDFFALMASLEAHMLKDPNVRDASPSEALENYFSRKGKRSQRRKNAFRAQRHRRDVMAEKFDTTSKNDGILRKTYKDGYAKFESSHGRVKKEDKSNSYHCKHPRERRRIEAANSTLADYMQSDICLDLYDSVFDDDDDYDTYMGLFDSMMKVIKMPELMVYLRASVPHLVKNIQKRGRDYEQQMPIDYLQGINNLYEKDCGQWSGWMYEVNGWYPNYGCSRYQVQDGDNIEWHYTCDLGRDLGAGMS